MFVRFVVTYRHEKSHRQTGVIQAAHRLHELGLLTRLDEARWTAIYQWFNRCLPVPNRFSRSRRPQAHPNAICWFKDSATEFLGKVKELAALLERHGMPTHLLRTKNPGYVVYEDEFQVAAVPFRDTTV